MLGEVRDQVAPFRPVFRRRNNWLRPKRVQNLLGGELLRHETEFHERMHAVLHQPVINLIGVGKVINGSAAGVLAVDSNFVVKNCVETNVLEAGDLLDVMQIAAIAFAQAQDRAPGSEHALPKMRERMSPRREIDINRLRRSLSLRLRGWRSAQKRKPERRKGEGHKGMSPAGEGQSLRDRSASQEVSLPAGYILWLHRTLEMISSATWAKRGGGDTS